MMLIASATTPQTAAVAVADAEQMPWRPSRVLSDFKAGRERARREQLAERETARAMADFRRSGARFGAVHGAIRTAVADLPGPAFATVSGLRSFGSPQPVAAGADVERGFAASATDRLSASWGTTSSGINADLEGALPTLRARSRDWAMNTDTGERFIELVADNIVGSAPPRLQVRAKLGNAGAAMDEAANQAVEDAWAAWCQAGRCEVTGQLSFAEVCRTVVAAAARDGEFLARRVRDSRTLFHGFTLQLLDVDRIDTARNLTRPVPGQASIRMGVEIDQLGRKQALWLHSAHPGDSGSGLAPRPVSARVDAKDLLHGFVLRRPEQVRGYPWAAAVLKRANTLDAYEQYAVVAAKIGAAKMGFYVTDKDAPSGETMSLEEYRDANGQLVQDVEAGMFEALPPGVTVETFNPDYPHQNYGTFVTDGKRGIAAGLNLAHHNLSGDMTGVNYSSARIAELAERRHWRALQGWFITAFVRPVFMDWLQMALLTGGITLPSGAALPADRFDKFASAASFQPPGWAWVDPQADIDAAVTAMGSDIRSLRQVCDENGIDMEDVLADNARLLDRYKALNLPLPEWLARQAAKPNNGANSAAGNSSNNSTNTNTAAQGAAA
jgi:lambda family phage portal protein